MLIFIASEVTASGQVRGKICHQGLISLRGRQIPIETIYGILYTTFGLAVRHIGQAGFLACVLRSLLTVSKMDACM